MKFGLIGKRLNYSYSKIIHNKFGYDYDIYEVPENEFKSFIYNSDLDGYNVTVPYKAEVIKYLDYIEPRAKAIGSVNTVIVRGGKRYGYNTDYYGFMNTLLKAKAKGLDFNGKTALVFGTGATSKTAEYALETLGAKVFVAGRTSKINYGNVYSLFGSSAGILVNATPVGTYPDTGFSPVDVKKFKAVKAVFDMTYNPLLTKLMYDAWQYYGDTVMLENGLNMLVYQAVYAEELFDLPNPPEKTNMLSGDILVAEEEIKNIRKDIHNITLIGMPGSGKSVIGRRLAELLGKDFADTDEEVLKRTGKTPEELIISGETEKFREVEEEILKDFGKEQNRIISTGGGAVEREANGFYIKQNSFVVYVKRDINRLDLRGRPLSPDTESAKNLFGKRKKLYEKYADYAADNNNDTETTVREIIKAYENFSAERT